jgi:N-acetyl sugar amidotransferase
MLKYCVKCVMPSSKPDLSFDDAGVCSACTSYNNRSAVDWDVRKKELQELVKQYQNKDGLSWDCIVPVSGGKDSTYQVIRILQLGLNPLCVTSTTCKLSNLGRKNIDNIKSLGVDHIEFSPNPIIRAKLNKIGLCEVGDISWPEHVGIFTIPVRAAVEYNVPLIIWGENSQNEYGGPAAAQSNNILNRRWLEEFGGLLGMRVSDLIGQDGIKETHLIPYQYPADDRLEEVGVTGLFLGHYLPWDGMSNTLISQANGFITYDKIVEGSMVNYENLDNHQTGIHDYFKFLKFGFGRATDIACTHIRRERLSREDGMEVAKNLDGRFPWEYLGEPLKETLEPLGLSVEEFHKICDRFTNKKIFQKDSNGDLLRQSDHSLVKINYDNP